MHKNPRYPGRSEQADFSSPQTGPGLQQEITFLEFFSRKTDMLEWFAAFSQAN